MMFSTVDEQPSQPHKQKNEAATYAFCVSSS